VDITPGVEEVALFAAIVTVSVAELPVIDIALPFARVSVSVGDVATGDVPAGVWMVENDGDGADGEIARVPDT
jgi:hypothetical protein